MTKRCFVHSNSLFLYHFLHGFFQVNHHHHTGLYRHAEQINKTYRHSHRKIFFIKIKDEDSANQGKRQRQKSIECVPPISKIEVQRSEERRVGKEWTT